MKITMAHGSGGWETSQLIEGLFAKYFSNPILDQMEDSAVVPGGERLAFTTDSFVVNPVFFPGGDIGRLAVCGTVNDLLMSGSQPQYLSVGMILQEGLEIESLEKIVRSMSETAKEAGVLIVAGDTKVVEGNGELYINTSGIGHISGQREVRASLCQPGDRILVSGYLGDHHAAIMSARMGIENEIRSDCAPLCQMVERLFAAGVSIRAMRDITRGGLATILGEYAHACGYGMEIAEEAVPVSPETRGFCDILGLDPLYMGNEGKMLLVVQPEDAGGCIGNPEKKRLWTAGNDHWNGDRASCGSCLCEDFHWRRTAAFSTLWRGAAENLLKEKKVCGIIGVADSFL